MGTFLSWRSMQALGISSLPEEQIEKIVLWPWLNFLQGNSQIKVSMIRVTALPATPETIWWLHTQDSYAQCHCLTGADGNRRDPWSPSQPPSLSLPTFGPSSVASFYNHWMASCPRSKSFINWLQPLTSHYPLHLIAYTSHTELISTRHALLLGLMAFAHAVASASKSLWPTSTLLFGQPQPTPHSMFCASSPLGPHCSSFMLWHHTHHNML